MLIIIHFTLKFQQFSNALNEMPMETPIYKKVRVVNHFILLTIIAYKLVIRMKYGIIIKI